jgi:3'(2'), 5'-bisphosphate nucleotidase
VKLVQTLEVVEGLTQDDIEFVCELTQEAGILAANMREGVEIQEKTGPQDRVTAADFELSRLLVKALTNRFPADTIVSEEDDVHNSSKNAARVWLIDPIDGTDNYIKNDGQWSVMVGLVVDLKPIFGWVFAPANMTIYYGGAGYGAWKRQFKTDPVRFKPLPALDLEQPARVIMGHRDRMSHPWVKDHPKVVLVKGGSIGLKVAKVLEESADIFVHLSGKLKTWDTAGPAALAMGNGLDVGTLDHDILAFPADTILHQTPVVVGRSGSLEWCRKYLKLQAQGAH